MAWRIAALYRLTNRFKVDRLQVSKGHTSYFNYRMQKNYVRPKIMNSAKNREIVVLKRINLLRILVTIQFLIKISI